jgi:hypothetical protein
MSSNNNFNPTPSQLNVIHEDHEEDNDFDLDDFEQRY